MQALIESWQKALSAFSRFLHVIHHHDKERNMIKRCLMLLAILSLAACSSYPKSAQSNMSPVQHPDAFHSYID
jgi:uncharacterized lipoprotein YajG